MTLTTSLNPLRPTIRFGNEPPKPLNHQIADTLQLEYGATAMNLLTALGRPAEGKQVFEAASIVADSVSQSPQVYDQPDAREGLIRFIHARANKLKSLVTVTNPFPQSTIDAAKAISDKLVELAMTLCKQETKLAE